MAKIKLFTDGGARGNPGPAAIGGVLYADNKIISKFKRTIGETTNNQAEYRALIFGLQQAQAAGYKILDCYLDSELVVKQLRGEYRVKDKDLQPLARQIIEMVQKFSRVDFHHVAREKNKVADQLVNQALDEPVANH